MYAIMGATGRIGGTVATELRHAVRAVIRNPEKAKDDLAPENWTT
jgi:uncharacterized protein YbjT (DUF2867 family)